MFQILNRHRFFFTLSGVVLFLIMIVYPFVWFKQVTWLEETITQKIAHLHQSHTLEIDYKKLKITGFPLKLKLQIVNPHFTSKKWGTNFSQIEGTLNLETFVWSPRTLKINVVGKTKFIYAPAPHLAPCMVEFGKIQGAFKILQNTYGFKDLKFFEGHGKIHDTHFEIKELTVSSLSSLSLASISTPMTTTTKFDESSAKNHSFSLKVDYLQINPPHPTKLPLLFEEFGAHFSIEEAINFSSLTPLQEWTSRGGYIDVEHLTLTWGHLKGEGNGTLAFDHNLQPLATLTTKIYGLESFINQLAQTKIIRKNVAMLAKMSLGLLKDTSTPEAHTVALSLQKGELSVGPLTLIKLPPFKWPIS